MRHGRLVPGHREARLSIKDIDKPLLTILSRLDCGDVGHRGARIQVTKVALNHGDSLVSFDVTDQRDHGVNRSVIFLQELTGLLRAQVGDIGMPTNNRVTIGVHSKGIGHQRLIVPPARVGVVRTPPLFADNVTLGVKLSQDRVLHAVRLDQRPELQFI